MDRQSKLKCETRFPAYKMEVYWKFHVYPEKLFTFCLQYSSKFVDVLTNECIHFSISKSVSWICLFPFIYLRDIFGFTPYGEYLGSTSNRISLFQIRYHLKKETKYWQIILCSQNKIKK